MLVEVPITGGQRGAGPPYFSILAIFAMLCLVAQVGGRHMDKKLHKTSKQVHTHAQTVHTWNTKTKRGGAHAHMEIKY